MKTRLYPFLLLGAFYLVLQQILIILQLNQFLPFVLFVIWIVMTVIGVFRPWEFLNKAFQNYPSFSLFMFCIGWLPYINTPIVFLKVYLKEYYQDKPWFDSWEAFLTAAETLTWIVFIISVAAGLILSVRNYRNSRKKFDKI